VFDGLAFVSSFSEAAQADIVTFNVYYSRARELYFAVSFIEFGLKKAHGIHFWSLGCDGMLDLLTGCVYNTITGHPSRLTDT
jgi:hypothetical protein